MQDKLKSLLSVRSGRQKLLQRNNIFRSHHLVFIDIVLVVFITIGIFLLIQRPKISISPNGSKDKFGELNKPVPTPTPSPSPTPTPRPLTFAEMNALYGPCVHLPVLMYHHIQSRDAATADKQTNLTVYTDVFQSQMQYLKSKGYNTVTMNDLVNFFDSGTLISGKSVLITFDDGYQDFYTDAYPILSGLGLHATMFVPTGLIQNPDYLTWDEISGMTSSVLFANHTWSHKNVQVSTGSMETEISTADIQLNDHGLNSPKVFAYPFGLETSQAENYLASLGYKAAFTTRSGSTLCKKQRFDLPRIRIGNAPLSSYGF